MVRRRTAATQGTTRRTRERKRARAGRSRNAGRAKRARSTLSPPRVGAHQQRPYDTGRTVHHQSEEHTSELQSRFGLVCRLLLEKKKEACKQHSFNDEKKP